MTLEALLDDHFWHPPVPNKEHPMGYGGCYCGWQVTPQPYVSTLGQYRAHLADQIREWLLSDEVIQRAGKGATEVESIRKANHGHPETCAEHAIRAALTAALDQGNRDQ